MMKTLLTLVIAVCLPVLTLEGQCAVDEIEYIDVYASHHCTSTSQRSTTIACSPVRKHEYEGTFHWKVRKNFSSVWENIGNSWSSVVSTGQIICTNADSTDNLSEFLVVFTENSTGCVDSCIERLVLDQSPIVTYTQGSVDGKKYFVATNNAYSASVSDQIVWFDHTFSECGTGDTLFSPISPCYVAIYDCNGCVTMEHILTCSDKDVSVYPNPANELLFIQTRRSCNVVLCDISGRSIREGYVDDSHSMTINTSMFSSGIYILRVCDEVSILIIRH